MHFNLNTATGRAEKTLDSNQFYSTKNLTLPRILAAAEGKYIQYLLFLTDYQS